MRANWPAFPDPLTPRGCKAYHNRKSLRRNRMHALPRRHGLPAGPKGGVKGARDKPGGLPTAARRDAAPGTDLTPCRFDPDPEFSRGSGRQ